MGNDSGTIRQSDRPRPTLASDLPGFAHFYGRNEQSGAVGGFLNLPLLPAVSATRPSLSSTFDRQRLPPNRWLSYRLIHHGDTLQQSDWPAMQQANLGYIPPGITG